MTVGLPGTGIGGVFYLLLALGMPLRAIVRRLRTGERSDWRVVGRQVAIVAVILGALWAEAWALGQVLDAVLPQGARGTAQHVLAWGRDANSLARLAGMASFLTLALVLFLLLLARMFARPAQRPHCSAR